MDDLHDAETADDTPEARFGAVLRRVRVRAGLSVRRLARDLDRAHSTISDFENGRRLPGVEVVEQYEDYFGLRRGTLGAQRERARAERLEEPLDATVEANLGVVVCPYMGLRTFEAGDAALFFGRETQVQAVLQKLGESRFVAVVGASGSGKSSFVRAGLLARVSTSAMNGSTSPRVVLLTPGEHPLKALTTALNVTTSKSRFVTSDGLRAEQAGLQRMARHAGGSSVIVVDQLEELFTLCEQEVERARFVDALIAAWRDPTSPVIVMIALRADFYGHVTAYPELAAAIVANQTLIGPLSPIELRRAIELPAAQTGLLLQPGLTDTILEDLAGEPGALPLLSHALLETWKRRRRLMLTVSGYRETGGVRGAIAQTAEHTLHSLSNADQAVTRLIFLSLTDIGEGSEPTRRRVDRAELAASVEPSQRDRVLAILAAARLVTIDERTVTVAHEALIRHWPRLRSWIEADLTGLRIHRRLSAAAREWDILDRETAVLFRGAQLATASEWATDHPDHLSALERDFLTASQTTEHDELLDKARKNAQLQELLQAARHRTHRLRILASGLAASMAVLAALAVWAIGQNNDAHRQASHATSLALSSSATSLLSSRPEIALLLAFEAYRASPRVEAQGSVLDALISARAPRVLAIMHGDTAPTRSVVFSPDRQTLAAVSNPGKVRLWDVRTHKPLGAFRGAHKELVIHMRFSPDGRTLTSVSSRGKVRLWDVRTHKPLGAFLAGDTSPVSAVALSRDARTLASASGHAPLVSDSGQTIRLWDVRTRKPLSAFRVGHKGLVVSMGFSADGHTLVCVMFDGTMRLWDARKRTLKPLGVLLTGQANRRFDMDIALSPNGETLASAELGGTIRLWDLHTHKPLGRPLTGHKGNVSSMAFDPYGRALASAADGTIRLWDLHTHKPLDKPLTGSKSSVSSVVFSPNGRTLASASGDGTIRLWDARRRPSLATPLIGHRSPVSSVVFSPNGRTLASASEDGTVRAWDAGTHKPLGAPLAGHKGPVSDVALSPNGRTVAFVGSHGTIRLWDAGTHTQIGKPLTSNDGPVSDVVFSPDGHTLASAGEDYGRHPRRGPAGTIRLWDSRTRKPLGLLTGHMGFVLSVAFSPDGRTLVSGDNDTMRLWDMRTHKPLGTPLTGHEGGVFSVVFSPNGRTLASAGSDGTIRLWDTSTHKQVGKPLTGNKKPVSSVAFSPDGRSLAAASADHTIWLWTKILWRNDTKLQNEVCRLVGSGLSRSDWAQYAAGISYRQSCP
jgi:WD40 repeat protein/transcriptional regulator with XRE-family HTH domain/energy-coupling factor transporter ATP-binding protein EcfA2